MALEDEVVLVRSESETSVGGPATDQRTHVQGPEYISPGYPSRGGLYKYLHHYIGSASPLVLIIRTLVRPELLGTAYVSRTGVTNAILF